jgi:hypothetical protein
MDGHVCKFSLDSYDTWDVADYPLNGSSSKVMLVSDATGNVFALENGTVYFHGRTTLDAWGSVSTSGTGLVSSVTSLVSDATGSVFALGSDHNVYELGCSWQSNPGNPAWQWNQVTPVNSVTGQSYSIGSLSSDSAGNVFADSVDGQHHFKHVQGTGASWLTV